MGAGPGRNSITHITANRSVSGYLRDLITHKDFLRFLIWKELKVRYRKPLLGVLWVTLQPFIYVLALIFVNRFSGLSSEGEIPFPVFVFSGVLFWQLFSSVVNGTSQMLTSNASILHKVYFPKFLVPLAGSVVALIEVLPSAILIIMISIFSGVGLTVSTIAALFLGCIVVAIAGLGTSGFTSLWVLKWPSFRHAIPLVLHVLLFISPVLFRLDNQIDGPVKWLCSAIPISGPIEFLRGTIDGNSAIQFLSISVVVSAVLLLLGFINYVFGEDKAVENA